MLFQYGFVILTILIIVFLIYCVIKRKPLYYIIVGMLILFFAKLLDRVLIEHVPLSKALLDPFIIPWLIVFIAYGVYVYQKKHKA